MRCRIPCRARLLLGVVAGVLALGAGCAAPSLRPADATLVVTCADADAQLFVDDAYAGLALATRARPLDLGAGFHRVEVRAAGRFTAYRGVTLAHGDRSTLAVVLHPDLDLADAPAPGAAP